MQQPYWWLTYATVARLQQWSAAAELNLFWLFRVCDVNLEILFYFQIYGFQAAHLRQREKTREPLNPQDVFFFFLKWGRERKQKKEKMYVSVWVRESEKEGFNAAGLRTQSTPVLRQDFHVSEGLDSKVKLKRGSSSKRRKRKKSFGEWDYVHFISSILEQETKG